MAQSLIHALSACMALASFQTEAGLEEPSWIEPIAAAVSEGINNGAVDADTFDECMAAVRKEIESDASSGQWSALENVHKVCDALAQQLSQQQVTGARDVC